MQQDFHFYAIYVLSRIAGISEQNSQIIAYASQYTDDAVSEKRIRFDDGGTYRPIRTAHKFFELDILTENVFSKIFIPFHFLPGNVEEEGFYNRLICYPDSLPAREMVMDVLLDNKKPYFFHRLGIALHTYADTWAHQNFSGILHKNNKVKYLHIENGLVMLEEYFDEEWEGQTINLIPPLGHGQAGKVPDIPYQIWKYLNYEKKEISVDNLNRFLEACEAIFRILCLVSENPVLYIWEDIKDIFSSIFSYRGNLKQRIMYWKDWIRSGNLGFKNMEITYGPDLWKQDALDENDGEKTYSKRSKKFCKSNWKHFNDAAFVQQFYILHELLPRYDIYCS